MQSLDTLKIIAGRVRTNLHGWRTRRKILVIESDDWGSIRMPSKEVYEKALNAGYRVDRNAYERYDSLASQDDLELLFDLLSTLKDYNGNHPVITANCVVTNPDFNKIKNDNYENYHFELITETFKRYPSHANNFSIWQQGYVSKIFYPQFHGREHLNISLFMDALRSGDKDAHFGFENKMPGSISLEKSLPANNYITSNFYRNKREKEIVLKNILHGLDIFEELFKYKSESFIPTNYIWSPDFDRHVFQKGVMFYQGLRKFREPDMKSTYYYHTVYLGKKNENGQLYLVRNAMFEPSFFRFSIKDPVEQCLSDINIAFRMQKPAILSSHRLNFVGYIDESNRDKNLELFQQLLCKILNKWPEVEFMSSSDLGKLILST